MFENGFDAGYVIRHPLFLATFIIAVPAWIVAFAGQCATEAQYDSMSSRQHVNMETLMFQFLEVIDLWSVSFGSPSGFSCKSIVKTKVGNPVDRNRAITIHLLYAKSTSFGTIN
jgi:hypothetical protein